MVVLVESKSMPVTTSLRAAAAKQAQKIFKLGSRVLSVRVSMETVAKKKNDGQAAVVQYLVQVPGRVIVVRRKAKDVYLALGEAAQHAARQVKKLKERRISSKRQARDEHSLLDLEDVHLST
jgi:ribosomal subunit interface protein